MIHDKETRRELYGTAWTREFLYTKPFISATIFQVGLTKEFYDFNKKRLKSFKYPDPENQIEKRFYEISSILDSSDLEMGKEFSLFLVDAKECYDISHQISHNPNKEHINKLKNKLINLKIRIKKLREIIEKREKIWPEWDLYLDWYLKEKNKNQKLFFELIKDLSKIPLLGFLSSLLFRGLREVKERVGGV